MAYYKCGSIHPTQNSNVVVDTASGAVANFQTPLAMPLKSLKVDVNAVQDLHGQSGAYPPGGSAQIWDEEWEVGYYSVDGRKVGSNGIRSKNPIPVMPNTTYYFNAPYNCRNAIMFYDANGDFLSNKWVVHNNSFTTPDGCYFIAFDQSTDYGDVYKNNISINYPATDTAYHPYSNICPIDGWSEVELTSCGTNLFNIATKTDNKALVWTSGATFNENKSVVSDFIAVKEGYKYTSQYFAQVIVYDKDRNYIGNVTSYGQIITTSGNSVKTADIPSGYGVAYVRLGFRSTENGNEDMTQKTDITFSVGNTAIVETHKGSTEVINLGGTYYGGYVSQDKDGHRQFVVTHGVKLFRELDFGRSNNGNKWESYRFYALIDKLRGKDVKCSHYEAFSTWSASDVMNNETLIAPKGSDYIYVRDDNYTTVEAFKTANTNTQVWYELAEPFTVALPDGQPIKSFAGINNIFADTGDTSVQFRKIG